VFSFQTAIIHHIKSEELSEAAVNCKILDYAPSTLNRNKGIQAAAKKTSLGVL
jgi:hypothetical protein